MELQKLANLSLSGKASPEDLKFKGVDLEDLGLMFTLPGYDSIELIENGKDIEVKFENLQEYIDKVTRFYLWDSIKIQVCDLCEGIQNLVPQSTFSLFSENELISLFSGEQKAINWTIEELYEGILPAHGYNTSSQSYRNFIEILDEMSMDERITFVKFVTGTSRLPFGGLKALKPTMTVVKSTAEVETSTDSLLPSVMTCQNYIKLPDYSSKPHMKAKLFYAINEGQNNFSLS